MYVTRSVLLEIQCWYTCCFFCFFKQKTAYEMRISDWSSDVCSSDLASAWIPRYCPSGSKAPPPRPNPEHLRDLMPPAHRAEYACGRRCRRKAVVRRHNGGWNRLPPIDLPERRDRLDKKASRHPSRRSEEHTAELQSLMRNSYAVLVLKQNKNTNITK